MLCTIYPIYKIIGPKYMQILAEGLQVRKYTGSIRYHFFSVILIQLVLLLPLLFLLIARKLTGSKNRIGGEMRSEMGQCDTYHVLI